MIIFIDFLVEGLKLSNSTVVTLEIDQGIMDVIRWIEQGKVNISNFDIVSLMIGRVDLKRSREWYMASVEEFLRVVHKFNGASLILLGVVIPSIDDARWMVTEFLARNNLLQRRCILGSDRYKVEYIRPGKVLLGKGGPVAKCYGPDAKLNEEGILRFRNAIVDKFFSADLAA